MARAGTFDRDIIARRFTSLRAALLVIASVAPLLSAQASHVRWDIINVTFDTPHVVSAGGMASARARDDSMITLTGRGTFVAAAGGAGRSSATTGGGRWTCAILRGGLHERHLRGHEPGEMGAGARDSQSHER